MASARASSALRDHSRNPVIDEQRDEAEEGDHHPEDGIGRIEEHRDPHSAAGCSTFFTSAGLTSSPRSLLTTALAVSAAISSTLDSALVLVAAMRASASVSLAESWLSTAGALLLRLGGELLAHVLGHGRRLLARLAQRLLVGGERGIGLRLEALGRVEIALHAVAPLLDHLADARQRHVGEDQVEDDEGERQPHELRREVARIELRQAPRLLLMRVRRPPPR